MNVADILIKPITPNCTRLKIGRTIIYYSYGEPIIVRQGRDVYVRQTWGGNKWSADSRHHIYNILKLHVPASGNVIRIDEEQFLKMRLK